MAIKKIVVPLDGSENAEKIGGWVAGIALPLGAEVALITVVDPDKIELPETSGEPAHPVPGAPGKYDAPAYDRDLPYAGGTGLVGGSSMIPHEGDPEYAPAFGTQIMDRIMQEAGEYLEQEANRMDATGVKTSFKALVGPPAETIVDFAEKEGADMIAMATNRGSAIARGVLGSVTDRVLRSAEMPVMAIHAESLTTFTGPKGQPEVVIVPLDGSERSASALDLAVEIAKACDAEVVLFRTVQFPYYGASAMDTGFYASDYGVSYQRRDAQEYLLPLVEKVRKAGVSARTVVTTGSAAQRLIEEAHKLSSPLIVMSTRGATGIKRWVMGSVTDKVVRSSGLPVLVIPPPDND